MSQLLPLFPLSLVVFPGEIVRLHIFEERYKQLVQECLDEQKTFGIPVVIEKKVADFATEIQIVSVDKVYPAGEMDIQVQGIARLKVQEFIRKAVDKLYPVGRIEHVEDVLDTDYMLQEKIFQLITKIQKVLGLQKEIVKTAADISAYKIGHHVGFSIETEYRLLETSSERSRLTLIAEHLEEIIPSIIRAEQIKARARMNGHYKNLIPPEF